MDLSTNVIVTNFNLSWLQFSSGLLYYKHGAIFLYICTNFIKPITKMFHGLEI